MTRWLAAALLTTGVVAAGCAPAPLRLPSGAGRPAPDADRLLATAVTHCASLRSITAEAGLSGRAGGRKLRGRLIVGIEMPDAIRLEAVAPFGPPAFILAAQKASGILLLPRDDRVLMHAPPADVLAALAGVSLSPGELASLLAGCVPGETPPPSGARALGDEWIVFGGPDAATRVYLRRRDAAWRLAAVERPDLVAAFEHSTGVQPSTVRLQSPSTGRGQAFDLSLQLSQVELNAAIPPEAFTVKVPPDAIPITLEELRQSGPMRDR
jgi:hypothetical protein